MLGQYDPSQGFSMNNISLLIDKIDGNLMNFGVENFMSFTTSYKDTGLTGIYFVVEDEHSLARFTEHVCRTWKELCLNPINLILLERAKRSLFTNMLLMLDGTTPICEDIGRLVQLKKNFYWDF